MRNRAKFVVATWSLAATLGAAAAVMHLVGYRYNDTASAPTGLWRVDSSERWPVRGSLVAICPPNLPIVRAMAEGGHLPPGRCPAGTSSLLKPVAAVAGDTVTVTANGVAVNGYLLASTVAHADVLGYRPMPLGRYQVAPGHVWLLSSYSSESFDSRYFGPVSSAAIEGVAHPVFVTGDTTAVYGGL